MTINFIPNDLLAQNVVPMRQQPSRVDRPNNRAGFVLIGAVPEAEYSVGTPEFLYWQCREAALAAVETWEMLDGKLSRWANDAAVLDLIQNGGKDLNAYYDRASLAFFEWTTGQKTTYSGASTDVVAHEAGHAFLDAIRPDLWDSTFTESNAAHEAFGDCIALVVALADPQQRQLLLAASPDLRSENFLEATAEDLSDGIRLELGKDHPAAVPRHAFNNFVWQIPTSLPTTGKPEVLTSEIHSFGRIFSGCFYDTICNIFAALPAQTSDSLWAATETAAKLLIEGARQAADTPRFMRNVGAAMVLADTQFNNSANHLSIRNAFGRHGIALGSAALLAPIASLAGSAPKFAADKVGNVLSLTTRNDLRKRIEATPNQRLAVEVRNIGGQQVAQVTNKREVALGDVDPRLAGVVAIATEPTLIGTTGNRAAVLGGIPDPTTTIDETKHFVETLLRQGAIALSKGAATQTPAADNPQTHAIRTRGNKRVLTRIRFRCSSSGRKPFAF